MPRKTTKITTSELLLSAIFYLQQKNGVTAKDITKYICEKRGCAQKHIKDNVKKALERATVRGIFCRNRGLYRINNAFGLNKVLSKTKRRGPNANKGVQPKENMSEEKLKFKVCWDEKKEESQPMLLNEMVDKRMNDDYDTRSFYVVLPISCNQDEDDDEDFNDSEDDEDDNDFFSDDNDNNNSIQNVGVCHSFTDPFRKHPSREYPDFAISKEILEERNGEEKKILGVRSEVFRERSEGSSDYSSEAGQFNGRNQFEDEYWDADQPPEEMEWDCQPNDLESIERLLEKDKHPMNPIQRKHVVSDITRENRKRTKTQNNSRFTGFIEDLPTDSFETSDMNDSTR